MEDCIQVSISASIKAQYDVIVCGGGPAGFSAAIAAARTGAKVALIESMGFMGGTATVNYVSIFAFGYHDKERYICAGIFEEVFNELKRRDAIIPNKRHGWEPFNVEEYKIIIDEMLEQAGVDVYVECTVVAATMNESTIESVIVNSVSGNFALTGSMFVDATGDGQLSFLSGVPYTIGRESDHAIQPYNMMFFVGGVDVEKIATIKQRGYWVDDQDRPFISANGFTEYIQKAIDEGLCVTPKKTIGSMFSVPWLPGVIGINYGRVFADPSLNPIKLFSDTKTSRMQVQEGVKILRKYIPGFENAFLLSTAPKIGRRESRRIHGLYTMTSEDIKQGHQFDDVIAQYCYQIDIHGPKDNTSEVFKLPRGTHYDIPYRCLVPQKVDNLLVAGRSVSATHEALGAIRVQPLCIAMGQAAGTAAGLCVHQKTSPAKLNIKKLQQVLREQGAILE